MPTILKSTVRAAVMCAALLVMAIAMRADEPFARKTSVTPTNSWHDESRLSYLLVDEAASFVPEV